MKKALVLVFSNLIHDSRVKRQIGFLKDYEVTVVAFAAPEHSHYRFIPIQQTALTPARKAMLAFALFFRLYSWAYTLFHNYGATQKKLSQELFDLIIANDIDTVPMAFAIKGNSAAKVVFDAHEYAPRHFEDRLLWRIFFQPFNVYLCKKYIHRTSAMMTVGKGLANEYETHFDKKPLIITNAPHYSSSTQPSPVLPDKIRLVHHGIANPSRRLELMKEMMQQLDKRFTLDLFLMTSEYASGKTRSYIEQLKNEFEADPRIKIHPAVPSNQIVSTLNTYDIGVFLLPPVNFNYANTLPNKFFEFVQARLGVAIGPTPEMAELIHQYDIGVVSEDFNPISLSKKLNNLSTEAIKAFKENASKAAKDLCAEKNQEIFIEMVRSLPPSL